jgi:hypothetical protein
MIPRSETTFRVGRREEDWLDWLENHSEPAPPPLRRVSALRSRPKRRARTPRRGSPVTAAQFMCHEGIGSRRPTANPLHARPTSVVELRNTL